MDFFVFLGSERATAGMKIVNEASHLLNLGRFLSKCL